jgi:hypothetical protein
VLRCIVDWFDASGDPRGFGSRDPDEELQHSIGGSFTPRVKPDSFSKREEGLQGRTFGIINSPTLNFGEIALLLIVIALV